MRQKKNEELMASGVTLVDPAATYIDPDVEIGADTVIHPGVIIEEAGLALAPRARSRARHDHRYRNRRQGDHQEFLVHHRLAHRGRRDHRSVRAPSPGNSRRRGRQNRQLRRAQEDHARAAAKANHLSYLGDATIGTKVNVGAGTITCNYDGEHKHETVIEDGAFIGSDSQLIAPVRWGRAPTLRPGRRSPRTSPLERSASRAGVSRSSMAGWNAGSRIARTTPTYRKKDAGNPRIDTMCGIIGYIGSKPVVPVLIEGLRRWSTAATTRRAWRSSAPKASTLRRAAGQADEPRECAARRAADGVYGMGHTRWATHGEPNEENAHPHRDCTGTIVVVHNGIIENYLELKQRAADAGAPVQDRDRHRSRRAPDRTGDAEGRPRERRSSRAEES